MEPETEKRIDTLLNTCNAGIRSSSERMIGEARNCNIRGVLANHRDASNFYDRAREKILREYYDQPIEFMLKMREIEPLYKRENEVKNILNEKCKCELW